MACFTEIAPDEQKSREMEERMTHRYETILYWSQEDSVFIAEVPELPGCMAHPGKRHLLMSIKLFIFG